MYVRIDEFLILSLVALDNEPEPTIAVLYANERKRRFIKTYQLNLKIKSINEQAFGYQANARDSDYLLLPMPAPYTGFCVVSDSIITCHDKRGTYNSKSTSINFTIMSAYVLGWFPWLHFPSLTRMRILDIATLPSMRNRTLYNAS